MGAGVHHAHVLPLVVQSSNVARVGGSRLLDDRESVHIRADHQSRPVAVLHYADNARAAEVLRHLEAGVTEFLGHRGGGLGLVVAQLWVCVQVFVERDELVETLAGEFGNLQRGQRHREREQGDDEAHPGRMPCSPVEGLLRAAQGLKLSM